jgi:hypothetical protein
MQIEVQYSGGDCKQHGSTITQGALNCCHRGPATAESAWVHSL